MPGEVEIDTPLGKDVLRFRRMVGREELGRPFEYHLELLGEGTAVKFQDVIAKKMTVKLLLKGGKSRAFDGLVSRFSQVGTSGRYAIYRATLRPSTWLLTRKAGCRVWQNQ